MRKWVTEKRGNEEMNWNWSSKCWRASSARQLNLFTSSIYFSRQNDRCLWYLSDINMRATPAKLIAPECM